MAEMSKEIDRVSKKQKMCKSLAEEGVDGMIEMLSSCSQVLQSQESGESFNLSKIKNDLKKKQDAIIKEHKDYHALVSKLGKTVEKKMNSSVTKMHHSCGPHFDSGALNELILQHFHRTGAKSLAETFANECNSCLDGEEDNQSMKLIAEMYQILEQIRKRDLDSALSWVVQHVPNSSDLEYHLHKMKFINKVESGEIDQALHEARTHLQSHFNTHGKEIQALMGSLTFSKSRELLHNCKYAYLYGDSAWEDLTVFFAKKVCILMGFSYEGPLLQAVNAGSLSLPTLLKFESLTQRHGPEWNEENMALDMNLGKEYCYHSVFVCPVSREQSSASNPPYILPCGHVICEQSMKKLCRSISKFKCPYCPTEVAISQAKRVYFD